MLTPTALALSPALSHDAIQQCLSQGYGLHKVRAEPLPRGANAHSAAFRIDADDGAAYFLQLHPEGLPQPVFTVPAFLHNDKGIDAVMAPLPATGGAPSVRAQGFDWALYPFFDGGNGGNGGNGGKGANGFERALTDTQWRALGKAVGAIHRTELTDALSASLPKERYAHQAREGVRRYQRRFINGVTGDDIVTRFFAFWEDRAEEIDTVVYRSEQLASILLERPPRLVPCHGDLHAGNVLLGDDGRLAIVGWHAPVLAPKERDLMFIGGGPLWNTPAQEALFYEGYGTTDIDAVALTHYRYERITQDVLACCDLMFDAAASAQDREEGLRQLQRQFAPNDVVAIAHQSYEAVT